MEMVDHAAPAVVDAHDRFALSLWSHPLGAHGGEIEDDEVEAGTEIELEEGRATAKLSSSTRTQSRIVPQELSPSGRLYQRASRFQVEFSKPTMSIKSQWLIYASSANPLPQRKAPSLTSWTPTASLLVSNPPCASSPSPKAGKRPFGLRRLMG
ncbi:putative movement protein [Pepper vein yellows virus 2]|uniref:Putative movement protein n=1 Tax=Pepper vein yellows virus 2 TaxID=2560636 RepID=E1A0W5_9VIRU|nr:putative movement protein [Pepper vein yellows virus 2]ADM83579.2 putative movement protein [Pepper vein yellows virus 2]